MSAQPLMQQLVERLQSEPPASGVAHLQALVAEDMQQVNQRIFALAHSHVDLIPKVSEHLIRSGGKRLRPMLTLASARLCGYSGVEHLKLASAVEFLHTATLLHDDVVDGSEHRRGKPTANHAFGNKVSVLVGDFLLGQAFRLMVDTGSIAALQILSDAAAVIAEGEVWQLASENHLELGQAQYEQVITAKTACLFAAACEVGAVIAGVDVDRRQALATFGLHLGIAFQMVDDALDYTADARTMGKDPGDDFREGKVTLPVIHAYQQANAGQKATLEAAFRPEGDRSDAVLSEVQALLHATGGLDYTLAEARRYGDSAAAALQSAFPDSDLRAALLEALAFSLQRAY